MQRLSFAKQQQLKPRRGIGGIRGIRAPKGCWSLLGGIRECRGVRVCWGLAGSVGTQGPVGV